MDQIEVAELGKPRLGEIYKIQISIKESKEFQVNFFLQFNIYINFLRELLIDC